MVYNRVLVEQLQTGDDQSFNMFRAMMDSPLLKANGECQVGEVLAFRSKSADSISQASTMDEGGPQDAERDDVSFVDPLEKADVEDLDLSEWLGLDTWGVYAWFGLHPGPMARGEVVSDPNSGDHGFFVWPTIFTGSPWSVAMVLLAQRQTVLEKARQLAGISITEIGSQGCHSMLPNGHASAGDDFVKLQITNLQAGRFTLLAKWQGF